MDEVARHYHEEVDEAARFSIGTGPLELARTREILLRYLPAPPARILDVAGGPGVYASWLASRGYEILDAGLELADLLAVTRAG